MESSHRGLRRRVAALALEVVASKSETQGHLSGCGEQSGCTWSSFHLTRGTTRKFVTRTPVSTNGKFTSLFLLTFYKSSQLHQYCEFQHDFFYESSLGYSNAYSFGKTYKTYHFVCFFNLLANVQILASAFSACFYHGVVFTIS